MLDLALASLGTYSASAALADAAAQPAASSTVVAATPPMAQFGRRTPGTSIDGPLRRPDFWSLTLAVAGDSDPGTHYQLAVTPSWFLADRFEFGVELGAWYINQDQPNVDDTYAASFRFLGRWHAFGGSYDTAAHPERLDWTIFLEGGIGMIFSADDVPPGGTSANFIPTGGVGATFRLGDAADANPARLILGARWHHISNARITGDASNPDFNAPMLYAGVQWGF
jgi:hypothetical protein